MNKRKGFTFTEIALFLGVTAALFLGVAMAMHTSITQQRHNDAVQSFAEFMRSIYSKVSNPQSPGHGNSETAIYGKLIVFGETYGMNGQPLATLDGQPIFTYDVVGDAISSYDVVTGPAAAMLADFNVNAIRFYKDETTGDEKLELAQPEQYDLRWQTVVQDTEGKPFKGTIMVVRHPRSGTINTLVIKDYVIEVNEQAQRAKEAISSGRSYVGAKNLLKKHLSNESEFANEKKFKTEELNFCISPYGPGEGGSTPAQNIRVLENARNGSSVQLIETDGGDSKCSR